MWHRIGATGAEWGGRYLSAALVCAVTFSIAVVISGIFSVGLLLITGIGAVLISTALGGLGPGFFAVATSLVITLLLFKPQLVFSFEPRNIVGALIFEIACVVACNLILRARRYAQDEAGRFKDGEARLRSLFDRLPAPMLVLDEDGTICIASAEAGRLFGLTPPEMRGLPITDLVKLPLFDGGFDPVRLSDASSSPLLDEPIDGEHSNGTHLKLRVAIAETSMPPTRLFTLHVGDITQQLIRQRRIQELQDDVAHMGRLTALGEMGAGIAHELNQPLSAAANYLGYARRRIEQTCPEDADALIDVIREANKQVLRAGAVLKRLRSFVSRSEPNHRELDLGNVVNETLVLARLVIQQARVKLDLQIAPNLDRIWGDKVQLQQVLLNLLRNAAEAMRQVRTRTVTLSVQPTPGGVVVCVRDTGPGVADDNAPLLFSPFNSSKTDGMGMGLAICRTIVEAHGGRIWCESPEVGGAAFFFFLPTPTRSERADAA